MTTFGDVIRAVALGDAWGDPVEFSRLDAITKNDPRGPEIPSRLRITDDTQMSLFLADALDVAGPDASVETTQHAIIDAFLAYYKDPDTHSRAPGSTVMSSLGRIARHGDWANSTSHTSDGSGTVMRTSPTAFVSDDRWVGVTAFAAAITHGTANAIAAAILDVAVLRALLRRETQPGDLVGYAKMLSDSPEAFGLLDVGEWLDDYEIPNGLESGFVELSRLLDGAAHELVGLRQDPWAKSSDPSTLHVFGSSYNGAGWRAHETLVIALVACDMFPHDHLQALRRSVVTTGDSDTIGAVTGALLAASGFRADEWFDRLEPRYQTWIADEADHYVFVKDVPALLAEAQTHLDAADATVSGMATPKRSWLRRLFS